MSLLAEVVRKMDMMAEKHPYHGMDGKIKCVICQKHCILQMNGSGTVSFTCEEKDKRWPVPMIYWEDIAAEVSKVSQITDLYLDFLYEVVEEVTICKSGMSVKMHRITGEEKSKFLHFQDHWLVYYSLRGDIRAKEQIVLQIRPLLKHHLHVLHRKVSLQLFDIQDTEQMIWLNVFSYLKSYNSRYRLWTWIKCIATRTFYKQLLKVRKTYPSEDMVRIRSDKRQIERLSNIDYWESCEYVRNLLSFLTVRENWVIVECVFKQKSLSRLAREENLKLSYLRETYHMALKKLRVLILYDDRSNRG